MVRRTVCWVDHPAETGAATALSILLLLGKLLDKLLPGADGVVRGEVRAHLSFKGLHYDVVAATSCGLVQPHSLVDKLRDTGVKIVPFFFCCHIT